MLFWSCKDTVKVYFLLTYSWISDVASDEKVLWSSEILVNYSVFIDRFKM